MSNEIQQLFRNPGNFGMEIGNTPLSNAVENAFFLLEGLTGYTGSTGVTGPTGSFTGLTGTITGQYLVWDSTANAWTIGSHYGPTSDNTNLGTYAMNNASGAQNVAIGYQAFKNIGSSATGNVAIGYNAALSLVSGTQNVFIGYQAAAGLTSSSTNVAIGYNALNSSTFSGSTCIAIGQSTMANSNGAITSNVCIGQNAGYSMSGSNNTIIGNNAGTGYIGTGNIIIGTNAGSTNGNANVFIGQNCGNKLISSASNNSSNNVFIGTNTVGGTGFTGVSQINNSICIGSDSCGNIIGGNLNICIGSNCTGASTGANQILIGHNASTLTNMTRIGFMGGGNASSQTGGCFIDGIYNMTVASPSTVLCSSDGQLGTISSSIRYKENVSSLTDETDILYNLRPVSFNYKNDENKLIQYGLIAEEVNEIMPELVVRNLQGEIDTVQYHLFPALLLNMLKRLKTENDYLISELEKIKDNINK